MSETLNPQLEKAMEPQKRVNRMQGEVNAQQATVNEAQSKVNSRTGPPPS